MTPSPWTDALAALPPAALAVLEGVLQAEVRRRHRLDGTPPSPLVVELLGALRAAQVQAARTAAMSSPGQRRDADPGAGPPLVSSLVVARWAGRSRRTVTRWAARPGCPARTVAGRLVWPVEESRRWISQQQ